MDSTQIATMAITAVTPYLAKGAEEIAKGIGKDLWELIKKPFENKDRDKQLVEKLNEQPENEQTQGAVAYKLSEFLEENPTLASELDELLKKVTLTQKSNVQSITGSESIGIQDVKDSSITIKH